MPLNDRPFELLNKKYQPAFILMLNTSGVRLKDIDMDGAKL